MIKGFEPYLIFVYLMFVLLSFLFLTGLYNDFRLRRPHLIDRQWKRVLWLISCLAFIPIFIFMIVLPSFLLSELKRVIKGDE